MSYWPASSSTTPRYAGPVSFFRLPTLADPAEADIALIGLPYDGGTTNRAGTRHGPREMRAMSMFIRPFHHLTKTSADTTHRVSAPLSHDQCGALQDNRKEPVGFMARGGQGKVVALRFNRQVQSRFAQRHIVKTGMRGQKSRNLRFILFAKDRAGCINQPPARLYKARRTRKDARLQGH